MDLETCHVLVTPTSYGKIDSRLKTELEAQVGEVIYNVTDKPLTSTEVARLLPGIYGYIAGLDALTVEPPAPGNPLLSLPQVIATPHLGAQTDGATSNMGWFAMRDCLAC